MREREIDAELDSFMNDVGFGKFDQRRVNLEESAFDAGFGSNIGKFLERFNKFRSAIGVAAVVNRVYAEKNVIGRITSAQASAYARKMVLRAGTYVTGIPCAILYFLNAASARRHRP